MVRLDMTDGQSRDICHVSAITVTRSKRAGPMDRSRQRENQEEMTDRMYLDVSI